MVRCSVATCANQNDSRAKQSLRKFHRFPNNEKLREKWKKLCCRTDDFNMENARVCSDHFAEDLQHTLQCRMLGSNTVERKCGCRIPDGEVPTLNLPNSKELTAQRKKAMKLEKHKILHTVDRKQMVEELLRSASDSSNIAPPVVSVKISKIKNDSPNRKRVAAKAVSDYIPRKKLKPIAPAPVMILQGQRNMMSNRVLVLPQGATMVGGGATKVLKGTNLVLPNTAAGTYVNVVPNMGQPVVTNVIGEPSPTIVKVVTTGNTVAPSIKTFKRKTIESPVFLDCNVTAEDSSEPLLLTQEQELEQLQEEQLEIFSESEDEGRREAPQCDTPVDQTTPGTSTVKLAELCRLCALPGGDMVDIFGTNGLSSKINFCLPLVVSESDSLPLRVCRTCVSGVEQSHCLATACLRAQNTLNNIWQQEQGSNPVESDATAESTKTSMNLCRVQVHTPVQSNRLIKIPVHRVNPKSYLFDSSVRQSKSRRIKNTRQKLLRIGKVSSSKLPFLCSFCQTVMCSATIAKQHYLKVHGKAICEFCFEVFDNNNELVTHINNTHMHCCNYCNFKIIGLGETILKNHINNLHIKQRFSTVKKIMKKPNKNKLTETKQITNRSRIVNCKICSLMFSTRIGLKNHYLSIHNVYSCVSCFKFYNTEAELENHLIDDFHEISCKYCSREFLTNRGLQIHLSITHKDQIPEEIRDPNKLEFDCKICSGILCSKRNLNRHYKKIHKAHNCNICDTVFTNILDYNTHCNTEKHFSCDICEISLNDAEELNAHIENHKFGKDLKCDKCDLKFKSYSTLKHHILYIHMNAPKKYPCKLCNKRYKTPKVLQEHLKRHRNEKSFSCPLCDKSFYNAGALKIHSEVHSLERKFTCEKCKRTFIHQRNLTAHMKSVHCSYFEYICKYCEAQYTSEIEIVDHVRSHTTEERGDVTQLPYIKKSPFYCVQCEKYFSNKIYFKSHKKRHETEIIASTEDGTQIIIKEKSYSCHICSKKFTFKQSLQVHLKIHLGVRPYQCSLCEKGYFTKAQLIIHIRSHTNERPFPCVVCCKAFRSRSSLLLHKRGMHDNLKTIKCSYCDKMFSRQYQVKAHMKIHTNIKPYTCETCGYKCLNAHDMKKHKAGHEYFGYPKFSMFKRKSPVSSNKKIVKNKKNNVGKVSKEDSVDKNSKDAATISIEESVALIVGEMEASFENT